MEYGYNCLGFLRKENSYYASGDIEQSFEYDSKGRTIKESLYTENRSLVYRYEYRYNVSGILIWEDVRDIRGHSVIEYDAAGNRTRTIKYNGDGAIIFRYEFEYEYDDSSNMVKKVDLSYDDDGNLEESIEYDASGNFLKETSYNKDGSILNWSEWEYDASGNDIKKPVIEKMEA